MRMAAPGTLIAFLLLTQAQVVNAFGVYAKGTITGKLLNLSSVSNYELAMNLNPSTGPANGKSEPPEILSFKVDGRDLSKPEFRALAMRLGVPETFISAVSQIDISELKGKKKITRPVYAGLQVDLVYKDETTKDVSVDISGDGMEVTEIVLPRPWLIGQPVIRLEARHRVRGRLTYDLAGALQQGIVTWEILVEPTLQKESPGKNGKTEQKNNLSPPKQSPSPEKPEEPPKPPGSGAPPGTGSQAPEQPRTHWLRHPFREAPRENTKASFYGGRPSGLRNSPGTGSRSSESSIVSLAEGGPSPPPSPAEPTPPQPPQPPPAPPSPTNPPEPTQPPRAPEEEKRGADPNLLAKFGFSYSLKVDFEIQKDPLPEKLESRSEK